MLLVMFPSEQVADTVPLLCSSRWLSWIAEDWHRDRDALSTKEQDRRRLNPGLFAVSSAAPLLASRAPTATALPSGAKAAAATVAMSETVLRLAWLPLPQPLSSPSGAFSNRRLSLCENPDDGGKAEIATTVDDRAVTSVAAAAAAAAAPAAVEGAAGGTWIGFKGCRAAVRGGEGDHAVCESPTGEVCTAGGLRDRKAVFAVVAKGNPSSGPPGRVDMVTQGCARAATAFVVVVVVVVAADAVVGRGRGGFPATSDIVSMLRPHSWFTTAAGAGSHVVGAVRGIGRDGVDGDGIVLVVAGFAE